MDKRHGMIFISIFILICACSVNAEFYEWVDENGNVYISNKPVAQEKDSRKIKSFFGERDSAVGKESNQSGNEWFKCTERRYRAGLEASELLESKEGWTTKPVFDQYVRQFANGFILEYQFQAKIPEQEVKAAGCTKGFQTVKVKTEENSKNRGQCRILDVSLGAKIMEPPRCGK